MSLEVEQSVLLPLNDLGARPAAVGAGAGGAVLRVSRCTACSRDYLPARPRCLDCGGADFAAVELPGRGTLYSFSTVHISSSRQTPYTIGYVDVTPGLRVLADVGGDVAALRCDLPVVLDPAAGRLCFVASGAAA